MATKDEPQIRNLFPDIDKFRVLDERQEYVEGRMIELAEQGDLSVVELCNQGDFATICVGLILTGGRIESQRILYEGYVDDRLKEYPVAIKSIRDKPIEYKVGKKRASTRFVGRGIRRQGVPTYEDKWIHPCGEGATEGEVTLPIAWQIMNQRGEYCVPARSTNVRERQWHYREIRKSSEEPKRRGRPPKSAQDEARA